MSKFLKNNLLTIAILFIVIALIIIRNTGSGRFRYNAGKWAAASVEGTNILTPGKISALKGQILILELDQKDLTLPASGTKVVFVAPGSLMNSSTRNLIKKNNGPVVLHSADYSISAKAWMALSQTGLKNLYILADDPDIESAKEKFRSDTTARPESN
jgi:hypothetical protein